MTSTRRSLVLITVDCLRADHCGFYGYSRSTTPFLDSLAAESLVVPTAIVAGTPTYYSFPAIHASRMPLALGRDVIGVARGEDTIATCLLDSGFATAAFSAANPYISARFGYHQGFEIFRDFLNVDIDDGASRNVEQSQSAAAITARGRWNQAIKRAASLVGLSRLYDELYFQYCVRAGSPRPSSLDLLRRFPSAEVLIDQATSWLTTAGGRPFFLWLHLMEPHAPYYPSASAFQDLTGKALLPERARYLNAFWNRSDLTASGLKRHRDEVVALYDAGILSADRQIARLVEHLRKLSAWDDCVFALTADHGEEFLEHGGRFHAPVRLFEEITRVPLMIRVPGHPRMKLPASPFSQLHLAPTLLELLDVKAPSGFRGRSLWRNLQTATPWDDPAFIECGYDCANPFQRKDRLVDRLFAVRDQRHKLVVRFKPDAEEELYDLQKDSGERNCVRAPDQSSTRKRLLNMAREHLVLARSSRNPLVQLEAQLRDFSLENGAAVS